MNKEYIERNYRPSTLESIRQNDMYVLKAMYPEISESEIILDCGAVRLPDLHRVNVFIPVR